MGVTRQEQIVPLRAITSPGSPVPCLSASPRPPPSPPRLAQGSSCAGSRALLLSVPCLPPPSSSFLSIVQRARAMQADREAGGASAGSFVSPNAAARA